MQKICCFVKLNMRWFCLQAFLKQDRFPTGFKIVLRTGLETGLLFLWLYIKDVMVFTSFKAQTKKIDYYKPITKSDVLFSYQFTDSLM